MGDPANSPENEEFGDDRLVWIFGSSRSGSTWLMRMLEELEGAVTVDSELGMDGLLDHLVAETARLDA